MNSVISVGHHLISTYLYNYLPVLSHVTDTLTDEQFSPEGQKSTEIQRKDQS